MKARIVAALTAIVLYASGMDAPMLQSLQGRPVQPVGPGISVLVFTRSDCPVSNRYAPELNRIYEQYTRPGVSFWLVYVDAHLPAGALRKHTDEHRFPFDALSDPKHELVKFSGAQVTPEVAVYREKRLVYRGRIDNRQAALGTARPSATVHDLEDVLSKLARGERPVFRSTSAVGCVIEDIR